ncbi:MAG: hypothetical protein L0L53_11190, partial [Tetragenococcus halophilus]|nr:hypothetical protein [Tetragenococcus halophilus]
MKNKFNLQALLISCLATFILSVAVKNDANTFVAAPFQSIQERISDESHDEQQPQNSQEQSQITETTSTTSMNEQQMTMSSNMTQGPVEKTSDNSEEARSENQTSTSSSITDDSVTETTDSQEQESTEVTDEVT